MDKTLGVLVVSTLLMGGGAPVFATQEGPVGRTSPARPAEERGDAAASEAAGATVPAQGTVNQMGRKLGRGLVNVSTGWMELPKAMYVISQDWGYVFGILESLHGLEQSVVRTLAGVYETATFPLPMSTEYTSVIAPRSVFTWAGPYLWSPWS